MYFAVMDFVYLEEYNADEKGQKYHDVSANQ